MLSNCADLLFAFRDLGCHATPVEQCRLQERRVRTLLVCLLLKTSVRLQCTENLAVYSSRHSRPVLRKLAECRYAAGATVQILLFGILAIEVKRKAPTAHTVLEIVSESPFSCSYPDTFFWNSRRRGSHRSALTCVRVPVEAACCVACTVVLLNKFSGFKSETNVFSQGLGNSKTPKKAENPVNP